MADWTTIASLSTAGGTLVLAVATFSSVRASQRTARIAERALLVGQAFAAGKPLVSDLLYRDHEGGQRAVSRFSIWPTDEGEWLPGVSRHFRLGGVNPRG